jgi:taurine dioxygenase
MKTAGNDPGTISGKRLTGHFAAEVSGVDLSKSLSDAAFAKIYDLYLEHAVLVFHGQTMSNEALLDFSRRFGRLDVHHLVEHTLPEHPEIRILTNQKKDGKFVGAYNAGPEWHTDQSFVEKPMLGTLLLCDACPPEEGNTEFADMRAAYDALPEAMKQKLEGLIATHDRNFTYSQRYPDRPPLSPEQLKKVPPVTHPMVRVHRETGRKSLYLSLTCISDIAGMARREARALVEDLSAHATRPEFVYSHEWSVGDLVVWDNRCLLHRARPFDSEKYLRYMRRTQIKEDGPFTLTWAA